MAAVDAQLDRRTLRFLLATAAQKCFPEYRLLGGHALGTNHEATHYKLESNPVAQISSPRSHVDRRKELSAEELKALEAKMAELVAAGVAIESTKVPWAEAHKELSEMGLSCSVALIESRVAEEVDMAHCEGFRALRLHPLHESTAALAGKHFHLENLEEAEGFVLCFTEDYTSQPTLLAIQDEHRRFGSATGVSCLGELNSMLAVGRERKDYILNAEFRQERKVGRGYIMC